MGGTFKASISVTMQILIISLSLLTAITLKAEDLTAKLDITFDGTSTLHDFSGHVQSEAPATWAAEKQAEEQAATLSIPEVMIKVSTLSTDHKKRDKNMQKMFEPETFPDISGKISDWKLSATEASEQTLTLMIHGQTLDVPVKVGPFTQTETGILLPCTFTLSLKASDLKRPSVLGMIRVGDEVQLKVDLLLVRP